MGGSLVVPGMLYGRKYLFVSEVSIRMVIPYRVLLRVGIICSLAIAAKLPICIILATDFTFLLNGVEVESSPPKKNTKPTFTPSPLAKPLWERMLRVKARLHLLHGGFMRGKDIVLGAKRLCFAGGMIIFCS